MSQWKTLKALFINIFWVYVVFMLCRLVFLWERTVF